MAAPKTLPSGDSASWTERLPDHPASAGWSLLLRFLFRARDAFEVEGVADGDDFLITLAPEETATWPAGPAVIVRVATQPGISKTLPRTDIEILPNLATAERFDPRTHAQKALAALREALQKWALGGQWKTQAYSIAGRSMTFRSTKEILDLIRYYEQEVAREIGGTQRIQVRF